MKFVYYIKYGIKFHIFKITTAKDYRKGEFIIGRIIKYKIYSKKMDNIKFKIKQNIPHNPQKNIDKVL